MEIWLDTTDIKTIQLGRKLGVLSGVTTNPSLISESGHNLEEVLKEILKAQSKPVTVQVTAPDHQTIVEQAETLRDYSERIIVKIPVTQEGLKAMTALSHLQFPIMATAIFSANQALFACRAGAKYLAPYYSRMNMPLETLEGINFILDRYNFDAKMVVASLKSLEDIQDCLDFGVDAVTLKKELFEEFLADHPTTFESLDRFSRDWKKAKPSKLLS
ncbi:MAG: transaldolase family protein [Simkaniaceae bacterium]